jgi:hypothetical protein
VCVVREEKKKKVGGYGRNGGAGDMGFVRNVRREDAQ